MKIDLPSTLSAPAMRGLLNAQISTLVKLSKYTEKDILKFHGIGPSAIHILREALKLKKLSFKK